MVTRPGRAGHSLVELMVTMMVLAVALSCVAATSALTLRVAWDAIRLEDEVARAAFILDSLAVHDHAPTSGTAAVERTTFEWVVTPMPDDWSRLVVKATDRGTGATIVELAGAWAPAPPVVTLP